MDEKQIRKIDEKPRDSTRETQNKYKMQDTKRIKINNLVKICVICGYKREG